MAQRVGRGIAVLFHDRGTRRGWVVSSTPRPHFTPGKDPIPILQEAGWPPGPVWTGGKSRPQRDSIPDRPARSSDATRPTSSQVFLVNGHLRVWNWLVRERHAWKSEEWCFITTTDQILDTIPRSVKSVKCTLVHARRFCTGNTAHRGSRSIALLFLDHGTRRGWGVSVTPRPLFTRGKYPVPIVHEAGWAPGPVWTCAENLAPTGIRSPDRPCRSQSLYRLRYPAHLFQEACFEWIPLCSYCTETCRLVLEVELRFELVLARNYINHVLLAFRPAVLNLRSVDRLSRVRELGLRGWITYYALAWLKFSFSFSNECRKQSNLWPVDSKNCY